MNSKSNVGEMLCDKCNTEMKIVSQCSRLMERDEVGDDLSDGEEADYSAAELGGDSSNYEITVVTYLCPKCNLEKIVEII